MIINGEAGFADKAGKWVVGVKGGEVYGGELHGEGPVAFALFEAEPFVFFELAEVFFGAFIFEVAVCDGGSGEGGQGGVGED